MLHFFAKSLFDYRSYEEQITVMHEKYRAGGRDIVTEEQGVEFSQIALEAKTFAKAMAKDIKEGSYKIEPAILKTIVVKGKERVIYKFNLPDTILHGVVSELIHNYCKEYFSENLHSYIKGRNYWDALKKFANFSKSHFQSNIPKKEKGLYVLRRDIASYTDTIPVGETSPLWDLLKRELKYPSNPNKEEELAWGYLKGVIQAEVKASLTSEAKRNETGVPTGSPISTTLFNLYMVDLDRSIDSLNPGFYARYGDDLILADRDIIKAQQADEIFKKTLEKYLLKSKEEKEDSIYFNIAGRHPDTTLDTTHNQMFKGCDRLVFLGCDIMAKGTVSVSRKLEKEIIMEIDNRLSQTSSQIRHSDIPSKEILRRYCQIVNQTLDPKNRLAHKSAGLLRHGVNDRPCLKRLDYSISRLILKHVYGNDSVKNFRSLPIKSMRHAGLESLVNNRNSVGKKLKIISSKHG